MNNVAILSHKGQFSSFSYNGHVIRFKTSGKLERYIRVIEWDKGYLVVMAKYQGYQPEEEYIDLIPILENLYFDADEFVRPIEEVRIQYD